MRARITGLIALVICLTWPLCHAAADWVTLKDGVQIHGQIIRQTKKEISLRSELGGTITFRMSKVAEIHRAERDDETAESSREDRPPLRRSSTPGKSRILFGKGSLELPTTFEKMEVPARVRGYVGELLGLYRQASTEAKVAVAQGPLPARSSNFQEMRAALRKHLKSDDKYEILEFERRDVSGKPAVYAEFRERGPNGTLMHLQAWVQVSSHRIYSIGISVREELWIPDPYRFRGILKSFQYRPDQRADDDLLDRR